MASSSSSLPLSFSIFSPSSEHYNRRSFRVIRAQSRRDGGRSSNGVDANLSVLRDRIEHIKMKEKLERCCRHEYGWNYGAGYGYNKVRGGAKDLMSELFEFVSLVGATIGFTCFSGTLVLCLVSIFVHLHHSFH